MQLRTLPHRRWMLAVALAAAGTAPLAAQSRRTERVLLVTLDGVRWQEMFGGADAERLRGPGVRDTADLIGRFWRPTAEQRREALLPFLWTVMATRGQLFGDSARGAGAYVTNGLWFSYPGYNELLTGSADPHVDSNAKRPNPNVTVLEFLNGRPCCRGHVAAFGSWDVLPFIVNTGRSGIPANGDGPPFPSPRTDRERLINEMAGDVALPFGAAARLDAVTMQGAFEHLRAEQPRVLYVMLGETDEWAHDGRYDLYLDAASRRIWIAVLGPDTPPLGVREGVEVTQSQVAATVAALLGEDLRTVATRSIMTAYERTGELPWGSALRLGDPAVPKRLREFLGSFKPGDYFAVLAWIEMNELHAELLDGLRARVRDARRVATCVGFGPRFLHSTGQAYKGGPNTGVFLQIIADDAEDVPAPGKQYSFGVVKGAQAAGDLAVLTERGRRVLQVQLSRNVKDELELLDAAIAAALTT